MYSALDTSVRSGAVILVLSGQSASDSVINTAVLVSARPMVTFPAAEHHCPLASSKLYCLVTETCV